MFQVFQRRNSATHFIELLSDGLLCFVAALLAALTLHQGSPGSTVFLDWAAITPAMVQSALAFALVMALLYSFVGLYRHRHLGLVALAARMAAVFLVGGYLSYLASKYTSYRGSPGELIAWALLYLTGGLMIYRGSVWLLRRSVGPQRVLIVGSSELAAKVWHDMRHDPHWSGHELVGVFPTGTQPTQAEMDLPEQSGAQTAEPPFERFQARFFSTGEPLQRVVREHKVSEIIVAVREQRGGGVPMDQLLDCRISGVPILDLAAFYERTKAEVPVDSLKSSWLVYGDGFVQGYARQLTKRAFDIVSSATLLILGAPVMLITALAIKLDSKGPVFYSQERTGLGGQGFQCIKFRSMRTDAEKDGVARWAQKNDSRITRVGAFIRKTRIDELPQLISVLRGEMSMVGPRPERPSFVAQLREQIPYYDLRHTVKPGLTGWAQVRYAYGASLEDARRKHQFDLYYVKNNSLLLDLLVLIETVSVVLFREGAH